MVHIMSAAAPVGSIVFSVCALLTISLVVLLILRHYLPLRTTPAHYLVPIFFALWLPAVVIILVPIDLASSAATDDEATRGIWLPERVVLVSWRITYWLTFALTWFILPILAEYSDSGYRDPNDKLRYSLRQNAQFYAMVTAAGAVGLVYVSAVYKLTFESLKALIMALSYCWGLILAIYLMGHGLVSIPRRLIRSSSISGSLRRLQSMAPMVKEQMDDANVALEEVEAQIAELSRRKIGSAADFQDWIEELQDMTNISRHDMPLTGPAMGWQDRTVPTVITAKYLAEVTRRLDRARHARSRYTDQWLSLVHEASELQSILDSAASKKLVFGAASPHGLLPSRKVNILTPYTRHIYYYYVSPYLRIALGGLLAFASVCIMWSEVVKFLLPKLSMIRLTVIHHWVGDKAQVGFAGQMISAMWICYMCAAALTSLTEVKVWRGRALVKRNTAYESAFWYASQVAKLCIPLSYNFLTFLSSAVYTKTTFYHFLGQHIDFTKLGRWFDDLFPVILMFPVFATLFGLYGRVKRLFVGIDMYQDGDDFGTASWLEGQQLIERELGGNSLQRRRDEALARLGTSGGGGGGGRTAPVLTIPAARDAAPSHSRALGASAHAGGSAQNARVSHQLEPPDDDSILDILGHRVKNTFDSMEPPRWLVDIGQTVKPKWMAGDDEQQQGPSGSRRAESDIRRWFGGSGSIRL